LGVFPIIRMGSLPDLVSDNAGRRRKSQLFEVHFKVITLPLSFKCRFSWVLSVRRPPNSCVLGQAPIRNLISWERARFAFEMAILNEEESARLILGRLRRCLPKEVCANMTQKNKLPSQIAYHVTACRWNRDKILLLRPNNLVSKSCDCRGLSLNFLGKRCSG
jgi:hypothetical protein